MLKPIKLCRSVLNFLEVREEPLGDEGQKSFAVPVEDESLDYSVQLRL